MTSTAANGSFAIRVVQGKLGLPRSSIVSLIKAGFIAPKRGSRNEYLFTFQDMVLLRTAAELRAAQIPSRKILAALRRLKAQMPAELPITGLRITALGDEVTVREGGTQWQAKSGQLVIDFEVRAEQGQMSFLQPVMPAAPNESAAQLFKKAEALEASDAAAAEQAYRGALALQPTFVDAYLNLGAMLCDAERWREAVKLYDGATITCPQQPLLHFNRAIALEDLGRLKDALQAYSTCLALDPELADAHFNSARLHEKLGDAKKAVRHYSEYRRMQQ